MIEIHGPFPILGAASNLVYLSNLLMYFDFEGSHLETPTIESAVSWRESVLVSLFLHLLVIALILVVPELPSFRAAAERRAAQLAELVEQRRREVEQQRDRNRFVFVQPRVDIEALEAPEDADASDKDRVAAAPERAEMPTNELPFGLGNSLEPVEAEGPSDGFGELTQPEPDIGLQARLDEPDGSAEDAEAGGDEDNEFVDGLRFGSGPTPTFNAGDGEPETAATLLGRALRNLEQYVQRESFHNPEGGVGQFGPWIQFDTKGVEFGPWIRRFAAQIRRNWLIPYALMSMHGHVVITFYVHKDGTLSEVAIAGPSAVGGFNNAALNALLWSNPTQPLPPEYPSDRAFFTVTFFYNEAPPTTY